MAALTFAAIAVSCSDDDKNEYTTSNDCVITAATMGKLVRTMHTTDSLGRDSIFYISVTGSLYPMSIDQERKLIYNLDSLPMGTDTRKVTFAAINSIGSLSIRSLQSGSDTIFSIADSTDFSMPRTLTVHSPNGVSKVNYLVTINVHKQEADSMNWNKVAVAAEEIKELQNTRSFAFDGDLYLFGQKEGAAVLLKSKADEYLNGGTAQWTVTALQQQVQPQSIVRFNNDFYAVNADNQIITSADGSNWENVATTFKATTLVAAGSQQLFALHEGKFYSSTDAMVWTADEMDAPEFAPETMATGVHIASTVDKTFESIVVVGVNKGKNVVWKRNIDLTGAENYPWIFLPESQSSQYNIANTRQTTLNVYDGVTLMSGLTMDNQLAPLYLSRDNGRTWKNNLVKTPKATAQDALAVCVDEDNFIWMFCGKSGEIWRGRLNRLGWDTPQGSFERSVSNR